MRTDIPLDPVPFAERMDSDLWESLTPRKTRIGWPRLSDDLLLKIRQRYEAGGVTQQALADEYGVHRLTICRLISHQRRQEIAA